MNGAPKGSLRVAPAGSAPNPNGPKVDPNDPQVRKLVYNAYREMLSKKHTDANVIVDSAPQEFVTKDQGIGSRVESMMRQQSELKGGNMNAGGPPPPPPPPPIPGIIPTSRLPSEIPPRAAMNPPPAALASAMMKDKKPFTYTPGGLDLSEISNQYPSQNGDQADIGTPVQSRSFRVLQNVLDHHDVAEQGLSTSQALSENKPLMNSIQNVQMPQAKEGPTASRFFRRLQTITDTLPEGVEPQGPIHIPTMKHVQQPSQFQPHPSQFQQQHLYQQQPGVNNNAVNTEQSVPEPKKYMGGNIPSRSFRMLQAMTGSDDAPGPGQSDL